MTGLPSDRSCGRRLRPPHVVRPVRKACRGVPCGLPPIGGLRQSVKGVRSGASTSLAARPLHLLGRFQSRFGRGGKGFGHDTLEMPIGRIFTGTVSVQKCLPTYWRARNRYPQVRKHVCGGLRDIPDNGWKNGSPYSKKQRSERVRRFAVNNGGGVPYGSVPAVRVSKHGFKRLLLTSQDGCNSPEAAHCRVAPNNASLWCY